MAKKTTSLILKGLMDLCKGNFSKTVRGNSARSISVRPFCDSGPTKRKPPVTTVRKRPAGNSLLRGFLNLAAAANPPRVEHKECRVLGYSPEQVYAVVANVDQYHEFVPWCRKSRFIKKRSGTYRAELEIGFPPVVECYTSDLTFVRFSQIRAVCTEGSLFRSLETVWNFAPGDKDPNTCKVEFHVCFEFRSAFHSHLARTFFDEVAKQMVGAFEIRASQLYGKPTVPDDTRPNHL